MYNGLNISVGRNNNFLSKARKSSILPNLSDIFDIRQHYIRILCIGTGVRKPGNTEVRH